VHVPKAVCSALRRAREECALQQSFLMPEIPIRHVYQLEATLRQSYSKIHPLFQFLFCPDRKLSCALLQNLRPALFKQRAPQKETRDYITTGNAHLRKPEDIDALNFLVGRVGY
jgi:hypothetical protein